ncbi:DUF4864 domain-containing protein [Jannaschia seosinensis]|nr:DUF4864 domain-containing protein [Jannaschia seosinensis]
MLKRFILAAALMAGAAQADESEIRGTIGQQIERFRADDSAGAFNYAAPNIRRLFGDAQRFGQMVRRGYPMVWQPDSVEYLGADDRGANWTQDVLITDVSGRLHLLEYTMVETSDGWRIAGVRFLQTPEVGA